MACSQCERPGIASLCWACRLDKKIEREHVHVFKPLYGDDRKESSAHKWDMGCECGARCGHVKGEIF